MPTRSRLVRLAIPALAAAALLLGAGCSAKTPAAAPGGGAANEVRLATSEWKFTPDTLKVSAGNPVTLVLENKGLIEHDFHVGTFDVHVHAQPRATVQKTVTFDRPGTYEYDCTIPGHKEAGMKGKIVVSE
ncbi:MAG: cupredoxin domain-containing protein [Chloroflexi bacterium]|nr:cupredoxin domain-containing protein [Chloroflexota bacterium]